MFIVVLEGLGFAMSSGRGRMEMDDQLKHVDPSKKSKKRLIVKSCDGGSLAISWTQMGLLRIGKNRALGDSTRKH